MERKELAKSLGHGEYTINLYETLQQNTLLYRASDLAELDIIYFLQNILWSNNFELIAKVITDYGMESRLDQWKEAIEKLKENK